MVIGNDTTSYIVDDLESARSYSFYVVAYMPMGASRMSDQVTQHTLEDGKNRAQRDRPPSSRVALTASVTACSTPALLLRSASENPGAQPHQSQLHGHPGKLAAAARQAEPRPLVRVQAVLSHGCRQRGGLCGDTPEQHRAPAGGAAARHHLPPPHGRGHARGLVRAFGVDFPPHAQDLQQQR